MLLLTGVARGASQRVDGMIEAAGLQRKAVVSYIKFQNFYLRRYSMELSTDYRRVSNLNC